VVNASGPQRLGDASQVLLRVGFGQQMPEAVEGVVRRIDGCGKVEIAHVATKDRSLELSATQAALQVGQRRSAQIETGHVIPASSQFRDQAPASTGRLQYSLHRKGAVLAAGCLDEVGFRARLGAKRQVVVLGVVVPVSQSCSFADHMRSVM
jgi:hypothetical protein